MEEGQRMSYPCTQAKKLSLVRRLGRPLSAKAETSGDRGNPGIIEDTQTTTQNQLRVLNQKCNH